jgi:predicted O-linked N-acetylglucosamine transferase (SPINDLY family)
MSEATTLQDQLQVALQNVQAGRLVEAERLLKTVVAADAHNPDALHLLGLIAYQRSRYQEGLELVSDALAIAERSPLYWNTLGSLQRALGRLAPAIESFRRATALAPGFALARSNLGLALHAEGKFAEAEAAFRRALELAPGNSQIHADLGATLLSAGRYADAAAALRRALELGPPNRAIRLPLARALMRQERYDEAEEVLYLALATNPGDREAGAMLHECRSFTCDWSEFERFAEDYRERIASGVRPFDYERVFPASIPGLTRADQLAFARAIAMRFAKRAGPAPAWSFVRAPKTKLRLGYVSADFREHPVANLTAELFELHDRARFEVFAYSIGPEDASPLRKRLVRAFDRFIELRDMTVAAAAERIAADQIDVLIDLTGYTQFAAPQVLALRPAPIQVNFLGYPGTLGADFVDYIVADRFILPPEHAADYAEAPAYLADCYMPNDRKRVIAPAPMRAECGLPDRGFVFCCFNSVWKITPRVFELWMGLLRKVPDSVLWLRDFYSVATRNLRAAADKHGLADRIVFAPRADYAQHLARLGCADLFLDTLPYNAHATASDALWAGLPVLTCVGDTFAARVCGSLLSAVGLPELITGSLEEYRSLALRLARDPEVLGALRERLRATRLTCPLFDSAKFTRNLEVLYTRMWERHVAGKKPAMIDVAGH